MNSTMAPCATRTSTGPSLPVYVSPFTVRMPKPSCRENSSVLSTIGTSAFIVQLFVASTPRPTASETHAVPTVSQYWSPLIICQLEAVVPLTSTTRLTARTRASIILPFAAMLKTDGRGAIVRGCCEGGAGGTAVLHAPFCVQSILGMGG